MKFSTENITNEMEGKLELEIPRKKVIHKQFLRGAAR